MCTYTCANPALRPRRPSPRERARLLTAVIRPSVRCPIFRLRPIRRSIWPSSWRRSGATPRCGSFPTAASPAGRRGAANWSISTRMAPDVVGFSDDGRGVQEEALMREAMRRVARTGRPVVAHCEVEALLDKGYIHDGGYCRAHGHRGISSESEWRQVERDIRLAAETGCRYHVCHVSTKETRRAGAPCQSGRTARELRDGAALSGAVRRGPSARRGASR